MDKDFARLNHVIKSYLTYSEIFGTIASVEEIQSDLRKISLDKALVILSQLSMLDEGSMEELKVKLLPFIKDTQYINSYVPFEINNILYTMKWFIAYGTFSPYYNFDNDFDDVFNVFLIVLKVSDHMERYIDETEDVEDTVLKSSLFLRGTDIDRSLLRQHIMFQEIARKSQFFNEKDYIDIHSSFEATYGYTIQEYVSVLMGLNRDCISKISLEKIRRGASWGITPEKYFEITTIKEEAVKICDELSIEPLHLRGWARETIKNPYDYERMLAKPVLRIGSNYIVSSPSYMNALVFEGLFYKIARCFKGNIFFEFYGKLFEKYVAELIQSSVKNSKISSYHYIGEFYYGKDNKASSDSYVKLGKSLLILECKGGRISKNTKIDADEAATLEDFQKYVMKPLKQANDTYEKILKINPKQFQGVKKVFLNAISSHSFPRVPRYEKLLEDEEFKNKLHDHIKYYDYLGIYDIEILAYVIENFDISVFSFLNEHFAK
ncbi:hypothetical protein P4475_18025, partial [Halalkalibacterium halodurans]|uniref:hypothetical protein n=1 Tax=Halalkalibacterium halodurans TaxID=86665 RepID=UPI002E22A167|nr:hypothetical protein [Halalkalibacterium halodurans]